MDLPETESETKFEIESEAEVEATIDTFRIIERWDGQAKEHRLQHLQRSNIMRNMRKHHTKMTVLAGHHTVVCNVQK